MPQINQKPFKINDTIHSVIDYIFVLYLIIAPLLLDISYFTKWLTFSIALIHLSLTVFTDFKFGLFRIVPFKIHGAIEFLVSILLIIGAFFLQYYDGATARNFYLINGICVFLTWWITDYNVVKEQHN